MEITIKLLRKLYKKLQGVAFPKTDDGKYYIFDEEERNAYNKKLKKGIQMPKATKIRDNLISTKQLCEKLSLSRQAIWNYRQQGMPVAFRAGKLIRYNFVDVLNWLDNRN